MDYKAMFEAVEENLKWELDLAKKLYKDYTDKGFDTRYIDGCFAVIEDLITYNKELRRIYGTDNLHSNYAHRMGGQDRGDFCKERRCHCDARCLRRFRNRRTQLNQLGEIYGL